MMVYAGPYVALVFLLCGSLSDRQQSCDPVFQSMECTLNNMDSGEFDSLSCDGRVIVNNFKANMANIKNILRNICCTPIFTGSPVSTIPTCRNRTVVVTLPFNDLMDGSIEDGERRFKLSYRCLSKALPTVDISVCNQPPITAPAIRVHGQLRPDTCSCQVMVHLSSQLSVLSPDAKIPAVNAELGLLSFNLMNSSSNEIVALSEIVGPVSKTCANNNTFNLVMSGLAFKPLNITLVVAASSNIRVSCQSVLSTTVMETEKALITNVMTTRSLSPGDSGNSMTAGNIAIVAGGISAGVILIIVIVAVIAYCILRKKAPERNPVNAVDNSGYSAQGRSVYEHTYETAEPYTIPQSNDKAQTRPSVRSENPYDELNDSAILATRQPGENVEVAGPYIDIDELVVGGHNAGLDTTSQPSEAGFDSNKAYNQQLSQTEWVANTVYEGQSPPPMMTDSTACDQQLSQTEWVANTVYEGQSPPPMMTDRTACDQQLSQTEWVANTVYEGQSPPPMMTDSTACDQTEWVTNTEYESATVTSTITGEDGASDVGNDLNSGTDLVDNALYEPSQ